MVNGLREGHGVFHYNNGDKYEGNFPRNKFNGKGVYSWAIVVVIVTSFFSFILTIS